MANRDRRLLELLEPIFQDHADLVETVLPPGLRRNWRQAAAYIKRNSGPKELDHEDLLLAMAELDIDGMRKPREIAAEVVNRFPAEPGAGTDERPHVLLPDGSRPARKDLLARLANRYAGRRQELRAEVAAGRTIAERISMQAARIKREGLLVPPARASRDPDPAFIAKLRAVGSRISQPSVTASQVDQVLRAVKKASKEP